MITTLGVDPLTTTLVTEVGIPWLTSFLGGGSSAPAPGLTPTQIAAALEAQRRAAAARTQTWLIVGGGVAVLGLAVLLLVRRK
jgi:hypothetical protein